MTSCMFVKPPAVKGRAQTRDAHREYGKRTKETVITFLRLLGHVFGEFAVRLIPKRRVKRKMKEIGKRSRNRRKHRSAITYAVTMAVVPRSALPSYEKSRHTALTVKTFGWPYSSGFDDRGP